MLSIKKRNPRRNLFLYGGGAFIAGFAGIMSLLVVNNSNIGEFVAQTPIQQTQPSTVNSQNEKNDNANQSESTDVDGALNIGSSSSGPSWSNPAVSPSTPNSTTPTQETTQPNSPATPTTPEVQPTEPTTEPTTPAEEPPVTEVPVEEEPEETDPGLVEGLLNQLGL